MHPFFFTIFTLIFVLTSFDFGGFSTVFANPKEPYIIAAYYENYSQYRPATEGRPPFSLAMVDPNLLTDLYYAFGTFGYVTKSVDPAHPHLTDDFTIRPTEGNDITVLYPQIQRLKKLSKNGLRVLLSIGGWSFNDPYDSQGVGKNTLRLFSQMVSKPANRKQFIDSAIVYCHRYGFDGIDIDWEYPGDLTRGGAIEDFANFLTFLKEASQAFSNASPPLILSYSAPAAIPAGLPIDYQHSNRYFKWLAECSQYVDRINMMAYDYHGPFSEPKITGVNAPLNRDTSLSSSSYIAKTVQNYLENGVPTRKILLGIPIFGHSYSGVSGLSKNQNGAEKPFESAGAPGPATSSAGFLAYFEISDMIAKQQLNFSVDSLTSTAIGYHPLSQLWVSFDTPDTNKLKAENALKNNFGGVIFWSLDNDEYQWEPKFPTIQSAKSVFYPLR